MTKRLIVIVSLALAMVMPAVAATDSGGLRKRDQMERKQDAMQQKRETILENREAVQKRREEAKEKLQTRREELKDKLQQIRDTRRKQLAEKLHERMCNVQQNRVAAQKHHLQSITNILSRVEERANKAKENGKDILAVTAAINKAKTAIDTVAEAVEALAGRDCGLTISGEEEQLKGEVREAQQALTAEVKSVHEQMVAARKAVGDAIRALAKVLGEPVP